MLFKCRKRQVLGERSHRRGRLCIAHVFKVVADKVRLNTESEVYTRLIWQKYDSGAGFKL